MVQKIEFKITDCPDTEEWSKFVLENEKGNIFQTPEIAEAYKSTKRMEPFVLAAVDENKKIQALVVAYISKEKTGVFTSLASRAVIQGGPLFANNPTGLAALKHLMTEYDKQISKKAIFTEIRVMFPSPELSAVKDNGYVYEDHLNFLLDINKNPEEIFKGLSKARRYAVKSAKKGNVEVEEATSRKQIKILYDLLGDTYQKAKLPLADISLFYSCLDILGPKKMVKYFLVKHENTYIGGVMLVLYKGVAYTWYLCGSREHSKQYPSDLVTWHAIEWSANNGYTLFDFGGAGKPDKEYGVREFKKQFGGTLENLGRYRKIHSPAKMKIAEHGFRVYQKIAFKNKK